MSEIVKEYGGEDVTEVEADEMASNSPNYVRMLVEAVRELDELEIMRESEGKEERGSFKEKVYGMGQRKGDKGIVPFLEGVVGLSLPTAMHLARMLLSSGQTLKDLVVKV